MKRLLSKIERDAVNSARRDSKSFEVEITIRLFGRVIWHLVFPPNSNVVDYEQD